MGVEVDDNGGDDSPTLSLNGMEDVKEGIGIALFSLYVAFGGGGCCEVTLFRTRFCDHRLPLASNIFILARDDDDDDDDVSLGLLELSSSSFSSTSAAAASAASVSRRRPVVLCCSYILLEVSSSANPL